ncbi:MAG: aminotransferase class I/II-fold pyridoxal phosphate-dependent enzyme [Oscillospiraceae bacterium]|nr:aminotransferase class I/II-fold pyridoxal phosphate-dependent enzyme [Oscillospiraceae bacterium]
MRAFGELTKAEAAALLKKERTEFERIKGKGLNLDMTRGKPGADLLGENMDLLDLVGSGTGFKSEDGTDCRNYGILDGLPEMRRLFAEMLGCKTQQVIAAGNSSLNLMFDAVAQGMTHGFGDKPWFSHQPIKFLCPAPGYDRHFAVCQHFGIEMITVDMTPDGPDMDAVEKLVKDSAVKGMWCVPKYSNPEGITYSEVVVRRIARLTPAARDFRVFWDNAYVIHDLTDETEPLLPILPECEAAANPDLVLMFASTSKITFPGAGVAAVAASESNIKLLRTRMSMQTIGPDKINQLRHARKFKDLAGLQSHMERFIPLLAPRFNAVIAVLERELSGSGVTWTNPKGGYFISVDVLPGTAKRVVELCKEGGVTLTAAGATFPCGRDPRDRNIRIAPTLPPVTELEAAMELFSVAVKMAALEQLSANS